MNDSNDPSYEQRLQNVLAGQQAPLADNHGRKVLFRCRSCGRVWFMDGARYELDMTSERIAELLQELGGDLATLPYALCRFCGVALGVGELTADEYGAGKGYGYSWEGIDPPGAHLIATIASREYLTSLRSRSPANVITQPAICRAVLTWLRTFRSPLRYLRLTPEEQREMSRTNRPGHGATGTDDWIWQGVHFTAKCPPLHDMAIVTLCEAMPPKAPFSVPLLFVITRELARIMLDGHVAGETSDESDNVE